MKKNILFIGGSLNQTTMMHQISQHFNDCECYFTSFYASGVIDYIVRKGYLDFTVLGGRFRSQTEHYFATNHLKTDYQAKNRTYDLVFTCQDVLLPRNIRKGPIVLVQEGMTEPENMVYHMVKLFSLPRWMAGTSTTGLSDAYQLFFVASEGYRDLFISKGVNPGKIRVTGIPNFDCARQYLQNNFPHRNYVLAATSDRRETLNYEDRRKFIEKVLKIAHGRQVIFKLHPNENWERATREINIYAAGALVFTDVSINPLIANCDVLITVYSSVVYIGMALGKEVYSDFSMEMLQKLTPIQNSGTSSIEIARITREHLLKDGGSAKNDTDNIEKLPNCSFMNPILL
ncbi:MAG: hypothetical protein WCK09_12990 [Bacteroidota bacterium]